MTLEPDARSPRAVVRWRYRPDADSRVSPKQTHRKQEDRGTTWYRPTAPLSGLSTCVVAFKPIRKVLVDDDGIALEAFLQAPLTRGANTSSVPSMQLVSFLEHFGKTLVLWAYGCMQTTLYIADEPMRHGGHCP